MISNGIPTKAYLKCGYTNYSAFYRAYKKIFGTYPSNKSIDGQTL